MLSVWPVETKFTEFPQLLCPAQYELIKSQTLLVMFLLLLPLTAKYIITIDHWQLKMDQFNCKLDFYKDLLAVKYPKIKKCIWGQLSKRPYSDKTNRFFLYLFFCRKCVDVVHSGPFHLNLLCLSRVSITTFKYLEISIWVDGDGCPH